MPPSGRAGKPLSNMSMNMLLRRVGRGDLTVHGFRSTFRDWCAEATAHPREVAEQALAHLLPDKMKAAYRRGDMLEKRRALLEEWAAYCQAARRSRSAASSAPAPRPARPPGGQTRASQNIG
jgi:integrase